MLYALIGLIVVVVGLQALLRLEEKHQFLGRQLEHKNPLQELFPDADGKEHALEVDGVLMSARILPSRRRGDLLAWSIPMTGDTEALRLRVAPAQDPRERVRAEIGGIAAPPTPPKAYERLRAGTPATLLFDEHERAYTLSALWNVLLGPRGAIFERLFETGRLTRLEVRDGALHIQQEPPMSPVGAQSVAEDLAALSKLFERAWPQDNLPRWLSLNVRKLDPALAAWGVQRMWRKRGLEAIEHVLRRGDVDLLGWVLSEPLVGPMIENRDATTLWKVVGARVASPSDPLFPERDDVHLTIARHLVPRSRPSTVFEFAPLEVLAIAISAFEDLGVFASQVCRQWGSKSTAWQSALLEAIHIRPDPDWLPVLEALDASWFQRSEVVQTLRGVLESGEEMELSDGLQTSLLEVLGGVSEAHIGPYLELLVEYGGVRLLERVVVIASREGASDARARRARRLRDALIDRHGDRLSGSLTLAASDEGTGGLTLASGEGGALSVHGKDGV